MKIANVEVGGAQRVGVVDGEEVRLLPPGTELLQLLTLDAAERERRAEAAEGSIALAEVHLLPAIRPNTLRDFVCFEAHVEGVVKTESPDKEVMPDWFDAPTFYFSNSAAIFGDGDEIEVPPGSERFDFELEVGLIVGRAGRDLRPEQARDHIAGYTIYNDFSARDHGAREVRMGLGWAKAKDFANVLGPWVVSADEFDEHRVGDRIDVGCTAYLNGERVGGDSLASMAWSFEEMLVYASRGVELQPGDVLGSGTCGGGCLAEWWGRNGALQPPPLKPGDEVRLEVDGIGTLVNRVVPGVEPVPVPRARPRNQSQGEQ